MCNIRCTYSLWLKPEEHEKPSDAEPSPRWSPSFILTTGLEPKDLLTHLGVQEESGTLLTLLQKKRKNFLYLIMSKLNIWQYICVYMFKFGLSSVRKSLSCPGVQVKKHGLGI